MIKKIAIVMLLMTSVTVSSVVAQINGNLPAQNSAIHYGSNILRLNPITAMDIGVGFGLSYEKILGSEQKVGLIFPVSMIIQNKENFDYLAGSYNNARYNTYVYFTPGVKIYPFGQRKVTYAVGPNLMFAYGGGNEYQYRTDAYGGAYLDNVKSTRVRLGLLANNYVNFQITRSFNIGLEGGLGLRYYDKQTFSGSAFYAGNGDISNGFDISGQFSVSLGLRF